MGAKWFWGIVILAIVSLILSIVGPFSAIKNSKNMGVSVQEALAANGLGAEVDMSGNVATLRGVMANQAKLDEAVTVAQNAECKACKGKKRWHVVKNEMTVKKAPPVKSVSPYVFSAVKDENGNVVLSGYVQNAKIRRRVMTKARNTFSGNVKNDRIRIARGEPNAEWPTVIHSGIERLSLLDQGRFNMEDNQFVITGKAASEDVRDQINTMVGEMTSGYNGAANIAVPDTEAINVGEIKSETICQALLNDLKAGNKINFAYNKAELRGAGSFDLLNNLASAAKQCSDFRVEVAGHTDADGQDSYNQWLSEARANTVVAYLADNGVEIDRMKAVGYGESRPIASNDNPEGMAANRRIEFTVTQSE